MSLPLHQLEALGELLPALDRFLEVNQRTRKRRTLAGAERRLERALAAAFRAQGRELLRRMAPLRARVDASEALREAALRTADWEPLFTAAALATVTAFVEPLTAAAEASLTAGARHAIAEFAADLTFSLADPEAVAYLEAVGAERVAGINETTRTRLRTLLVEAREGGWSYDRLAAEMRRTFTGFATGSPLEHIASRAHLVAVTETGDAYEAARRVMADRLVRGGLSIEKQWLDVGDRRVDPVCASNAAQGWIPVDQAFGSGHQQPTAHPGCRCSTEYRRGTA
jgi:hypothetical protein